VKLTLDRIALKTLIDADPEFAFELKAAVISEVGRRFFEKDANRVIAAAEPELFAKAVQALQNDTDAARRVRDALTASLTEREPGWSGRVKLTAEAQRVIDGHVAARKGSIVAEASSQISAAYGEAIQKAVDDKLATTNIEELIAKRVDRLVEREIDERANEKFRARMAELKGLMS